MQQDRRLRTALLPYQPRLLHDVLDSLDTAVVVLDETCRVLAGNVAAARLLGIRRGRRVDDHELVGDVVAITGESGEELDVTAYDAWRAIAESGQTVTVRATYEGGHTREFAATAQVVGGDVPDAIVCRYVDVTVRRELERRVAAAADQAARAEIDLVAAERRVALLEELLVYLATRGA